jgi:hypothetical protein
MGALQVTSEGLRCAGETAGKRSVARNQDYVWEIGGRGLEEIRSLKEQPSPGLPYRR